MHCSLFERKAQKSKQRANEKSDMGTGKALMAATLTTAASKAAPQAFLNPRRSTKR